MDVAGNNAVSLSLETILGNLISLACQDVAKLAADDFVFKRYDELAKEVAKVQDVKANFFQCFWYPTGKEAMRALAAAQQEVNFEAPGIGCSPP